MVNPVLVFLKRTYKVLIVLAAAVIFFLGYNTYLVDRSLVNLKFALRQTDKMRGEKDVKNITALIDFSLRREIAQKELSPEKLSRIELAKDTLTRQMSLDAKQREAKFAIEEAIRAKEKERNALLQFLDNATGAFARPQTEVPLEKLENQAQALEAKALALSGNTSAQQEAYYALANIYGQMGDGARAKDAYSTAIALNPDTKLAQKSVFNLAWEQKTQGELDEAIKNFELFSTAATQQEMAIFGKYQTADTYRKKGDFEKAASIFKEISDRGAASPLAQAAILQEGAVYLYDLKDFEKAKEVFAKALELFRGTEMSKYLEGAETKNIAAEYRWLGFKLLGEGYYQKLPEKYVESLVYFDKALELDANDGPAYSGKALAYFWQNDPDRALDFARQAVKIMPNNELASVNLGYIYIELKLTAEAITEFKRYIGIDPFTAYGYYNLGYAYAAEKQLGNASQSFNQAIKIDPDFAEAYNNLGWCYWNLDRFNEATEALERAVQLKPKFYEALFNLGLTYKTVGRYIEAKEALEKIPGDHPKYPAAQKHLRVISQILKAK